MKKLLLFILVGVLFFSVVNSQEPKMEDWKKSFTFFVNVILNETDGTLEETKFTIKDSMVAATSKISCSSFYSEDLINLNIRNIIDEHSNIKIIKSYTGVAGWRYVGKDGKKCIEIRLSIDNHSVDLAYAEEKQILAIVSIF